MMGFSTGIDDTVAAFDYTFTAPLGIDGREHLSYEISRGIRRHYFLDFAMSHSRTIHFSIRNEASLCSKEMRRRFITSPHLNERFNTSFSPYRRLQEERAS